MCGLVGLEPARADWKEQQALCPESCPRALPCPPHAPTLLVFPGPPFRKKGANATRLQTKEGHHGSP